MTAPLVVPFNWRPKGPTKVIGGRDIYSPEAGVYALVNARCRNGSKVRISEMSGNTLVSTKNWLVSSPPSVSVFETVSKAGNYSRMSYQVADDRYFEGFIFNVSPTYDLHFSLDEITGTSALNNTANYPFKIRDTGESGASSLQILEGESRIDLKLGPGEEIFILANANTATTSIHDTLAKQMGITGHEIVAPGADVVTGWTIIDENTQISASSPVATRAPEWEASIVEYNVQT